MDGNPFKKTDLRQQKTKEWHKFTVKNNQSKHRPKCNRESVGAFLKHRMGGNINLKKCKNNMLQKTIVGSMELGNIMSFIASAGCVFSSVAGISTIFTVHNS